MSGIAMILYNSLIPTKNYYRTVIQKMMTIFE